MFPTEVDLEGLSKNATVRWKKNLSIGTERDIGKSNAKRLHSMILTSDPRNFLALSMNAPDDSAKLSNHEDLKEISLQLSILRKKHDLNKDSNFFHDNHIGKLKRQMNSFQVEEEKAVLKFRELKEKTISLEERIEKICKKQEDALSAKKIYDHIIERMKVKQLQLDMEKEAIYQSVKGNKKILLEETNLCRKQKDSKIKTKKALEQLENFIEKETKEKQERLETIESDVKKKQENTHKREERYKRQLEIAEAAANEDREMRATQMREGVMMHQFWYLYMKKKLDFDMEKLSPVEKAFEKVRKNSSVNNANEMVVKFLSVEIEYNELKRIVSESNQNISSTKQRIAEIEVTLEKAEQLKPQSELKNMLRNNALAKLKSLSEAKDKLIGVKLVHQKIQSWTSKILKKFSVEAVENDLTGNLLKLQKAVIEFLRKNKEIVWNI